MVLRMRGIWKFWGETGRILGTGSPSRDCRPPFLSPLIDRGTAPAGGHSLKWRATHRWGSRCTHTLVMLQQVTRTGCIGYFTPRRKHIELIR